MAILNYMAKLLDLAFGAAWFLNTISLIKLIGDFDLADPMDSVNFISSTGFGLVGVVYGFVRIYDFWHKSKIDREQKKENLRRYKHETDVQISKTKKQPVKR